MNERAAPSTEHPRNRWTTFLAHLFLILAAWTLFIKYLFPIAFAQASGEPWTTYIYWDLWPVAHVWLAWALLARPRYTRLLAIGMSAVEILIIVTLFSRFLVDPEWSIWRTNWFVNKVFVLGAFFLVLGTAVFRPGALKARSQ
ncbi:hypothetical protein [Marinobacter orientalis]|uniref:Uncharacterized protein n=1 Tax=Marinobacter orientalis TaxID=1928859 RepID=A0A7Y0RDV0_9GAMM|nr:hypothetical protein [Marinobacter orientalis]NMT64428.1 hypothetical protein [Marinobacter orientalis]TGX50610.1 hypothetical protein DIT72_00720 [Marinobacter orientalis]